MSNFTENLALSNPDKNCRTWYLAHDFSYDIGYENSGRRITVPQGFATDGTSIPRIFWALEPPWGPAARASIIHDYLYDCVRGSNPYVLTRLDADNIFYEALLVAGIRKWKAYLFWLSVRLMGRNRFTN